MKAKFLPKNYNLGNTGDVRVYGAILQYNMGDEWLKIIYDHFKLSHSNIESLKNFRHRALIFKAQNSYERKKLK